MLRLTLSTLLICSAAGCSGADQLQDNRSLRLEMPYQSDSQLIRRGGVDGQLDRALVLQHGVLTLEQGEQTLQFDLEAGLKGGLHTDSDGVFVVYGTGLVLPVRLDLPDGTPLLWTGPKLKLGERTLAVPRRGHFRYDAASASLLAVD